MCKSTVIAAAVGAVAFCATGFAAVGSVKVSGDVTLRQIVRSGSGIEQAGNATGQGGSEEYGMSTARVRVDADLTDNVSTAVRLVNERNLGTRGAASLDADVDLAYFTLKEFFYAPLTVTFGRQNLWYGKGFILGNNIAAWDPNGSLRSDEYSSHTAFDAIKATLDYAPWTIDGIYSKILENNTDNSDDTQLWGVNVGYKFAEHNAEAEGYYFGAAESDTLTFSGGFGLTANRAEPVQAHTVGLRGSFDPSANTTVWAEGAYQFGRMQANTATVMRSVSAWAADAGGEYKFSNCAWKPKLGGEYVYYSGESNPSSTAGEWNGWLNITRGKSNTLIREFHNVSQLNLDAYDIGGWTNQHQFTTYGVLRPSKSTAVSFKHVYFMLARKYASVYTNNRQRSRYIGNEIDGKLTYDYTGSIQLGLSAGLFLPGRYYAGAQGSAADRRQTNTEHLIVGSAKVTF